MPKWFKEGTAQFIDGADERLAIDIHNNGKEAVIQAISDGTDRFWGNSSLEYSAGYVATKYLDDKLDAQGGMKGLLVWMAADKSRTFDQALVDFAGYSSRADFTNDFKVNGLAYMDSLDLTNNDTGAIGGKDDGGPNDLNARDVISDQLASNPNDPTNGAFNITWPQGLENVFAAANPSAPLEVLYDAAEVFSMTRVPEIKIQLGANSTQNTKIILPTVNITQLATNSLNAVLRPNLGITVLDRAISTVSNTRSYFGALQNRLEHSYENVMNTAENLQAAESRIRDTDMAKEMMNFTKQNMLMQAAQSMLVQANQQPQEVLQLLV